MTALSALHFTFNKPYVLFVVVLLFGCTPKPEQIIDSDGWTHLFNGSDLTGWKTGENPESWTVEDSSLTGIGERSHLFYTGDELKDGFKNFELEVEVMTQKLANSGIYFHTEFQEENWPSKGHEIQVNNTHLGIHDYTELKKTGSLYGIRNTYKAFARDNEWNKIRIVVQGARVEVWVNDINTVDYVMPGGPDNNPLSSGTFALQCHDPDSKVQYRSVRVKRLSTPAPPTTAYVPGPWYQRMQALQKDQFPFIDLHPQFEGPDNIAERVKFYYQTGINAGSLTTGRDLENVPEVTRTLEERKVLPVFFGVKLTLSDFDSVDQNILAPFEYTIGTTSTTHRILDEYAEEIRALLAHPKIDIWSKPFYLPNGPAVPPALVDELLNLAASNKIAIEIDNTLKAPSLEVLRKAKNIGCRFTFSNISPEHKMKASQYVIEVSEELGLKYQDIYVPGWEEQDL